MKMKKFAIAGLIAGAMLVFAGCEQDAKKEQTLRRLNQEQDQTQREIERLTK